jgi:flagellar biosynthetic protein FlhB
MSDDEDKSQKTEDPTQKKLEEAFKEGQIPFSREMLSFAILFIFVMMMIWMMPTMLRSLMTPLSVFIGQVHQIPGDPQKMGAFIGNEISTVAGVMLPFFALLMVIVLLVGGSQTKFGASVSRIQPKLSKISPIKGLERLFSLRTFVEFLKGIAKIVFVGAIAFVAAWPMIDSLPKLPYLSLPGVLDFIQTLLVNILIGAVIFMFFVSVVDYIYQRYDHIEQLRMSKREIKDEHKQQEGDPQVKQKLRQIRAERARGSMMTKMVDADVVITNPTHYAVALKYEMGEMRAPICMAKGLDHMAKRIRELADDNDIPIVENPPLARALYATIEVDEEIPTEHFKAVAEVISYVYKLKKKPLKY